MSDLQVLPASDLSHFVAASDGVAHLTLAVEGINCAGCIGRIEKAVAALPGVQRGAGEFHHQAAVDRGRAVARPVEGDRCAGNGSVIAPIRSIPARVGDEEAQRGKQLLLCLAVAGFGAMNVMLLSVSVWSGNATDITTETRDLFHWLSALIALPVAAYAGRPFFQSAFAALKSGRVNMDVPISLGITLALGMSLVETIQHAEHAYFDSAVMLIFFLLCGRYLDQAMRGKTRAVAGNLAALKAETARRIEPSGELLVVPSAVLQAGDRVMVLAGERVPADGIVRSGNSSLDESLITGETTLASGGCRRATLRRQPQCRGRHRDGGRRRRAGHAAGRDRAAAGAGVCSEIPLRATRRSRRALLCAGRAHRGCAHGHWLAGRGSLAARRRSSSPSPC